MRLTVQKRLAGDILKCSPSRITFDETSLEIIKESITKADVRALIGSGVITRKPVISVSRGRARKIQVQKAKGLRKGVGSRKGRANARQSTKDDWINRVRLQRTFAKSLRDNKHITTEVYHNLYSKIKGGFFRNKRHVKLYLEERGILQKQ